MKPQVPTPKQVKVYNNLRELLQKAQDCEKGNEQDKFHQNSTEKSLKAIAEMKKKPINYEEEYRRHFLMNKVCNQLDLDPTVTKENWKEKYNERMVIAEKIYDKEKKESKG